jgi:serine phosphatase RsbU (regulator of sigma subunit)
MFRFPQYVLGKQLEQQTELARQVQKDLCPPANPSFENLDFAAECVSAWQVGGDFYDVFRTDQGSVALESERLEEGGPVLGVLTAQTYRQGNIALSTGDLAVLYSDGVVLAMNASEEEFGEDRLRTVIRKNSAKSPAEIRDEILKQVRSFLGEEQLQDDLTLVVARIR